MSGREAEGKGGDGGRGKSGWAEELAIYLKSIHRAVSTVLGERNSSDPGFLPLFFLVSRRTGTGTRMRPSIISISIQYQCFFFGTRDDLT